MTIRVVKYKGMFLGFTKNKRVYRDHNFMFNELTDLLNVICAPHKKNHSKTFKLDPVNIETFFSLGEIVLEAPNQLILRKTYPEYFL